VVSSVLEAARHAALWEGVAAELRRAIIYGELPAGLHLEEPSLARKFGISRVPVREAIARLEREGLVRIEPRRGAFVVGFAEDDVGNVYGCRRLIELASVRRAAARVQASGLARLRALADRMDDAVRRRRSELMAEPDVEYHRQLVSLAENRFLLGAWEPLAGLVTAMLEITDTTYDNLPVAVASHREIVDALEGHDADRAERLLAEHLREGERVMREALARLAGDGALAGLGRGARAHGGEAG